MKNDDFDLNSFISGIQNKDEADFYIEVCDYFNFRNLSKLFDLNDLISAYSECIKVLKTHSEDFHKTCVFIKNVTENRRYNDVQKYNFYLLMHIFFEYLLLNDDIKRDEGKYIDWIETQLELVNDVATAYYYDFEIKKLVEQISHKPANEQIRILTEKKRDYILTLTHTNLPPNDFDLKCDEQIKLINELLSVGYEFGNKEETQDDIKSVLPSDHDKLEKPKPELTMPDLSSRLRSGGVKFAAEYTEYAVSTIRRLANEGKIPCHKPTETGKYRFFADELDDWLKNGMKNFQSKSDDKLIGKQGRKKHGND